MTADTRTFKTCDVCHRTLRIGMFIDLQAHQVTEECWCCKYQASLLKHPGQKRLNICTTRSESSVVATDLDRSPHLSSIAAALSDLLA
ncbi:hypothetical protein GGS21DRAFT_486927 [Xylaria nigripes]|nr:hypothetical protein GGS21DRAFT_486927 [Xylaria nigripes]